MGRRLNHNRPGLPRRGPLNISTGPVARAVTGRCSANRLAPNGEVCLGWEGLLEQLDRQRKDQPEATSPDPQPILCPNCLLLYARGLRRRPWCRS